MQIENEIVYNGDIGTIDDVDSNSGELIASFDGRSVTYGFGELDMLVPAYAATIHKSQGSEYPAVIIPVLTQHYAMLQWNLLYTGVTRGKKLIVLVGQRKAAAIAVRNVSGRKRWSKLSEWLQRTSTRSQLPLVFSILIFRVRYRTEEVFRSACDLVKVMTCAPLTVRSLGQRLQLPPL